jgi:RNA polymerase sigma-70 factor (ECF subfamily)
MGIGSESTSSSLLDRVRARDADAWRRLIALYGPLVYGWCRRAGLAPEESADRGQEVFMAVARSIETFDHSQPGMIGDNYSFPSATIRFSANDN